MKISKILLICLLVFSLNAQDKAKTIIVGASAVPHAVILQKVVKPLLEKDGYELEVRIFNDYIEPNLALENGELDANYFQDLLYLQMFNKEQGTNIVPTAMVHIEPMGAYSRKIKNLSEIKEGDLIAISNNSIDANRALEILESTGVIKLNKETFKTPLDIIKNPKKLKFKEVRSSQILNFLDHVVLAFINTNYALEAGLEPKDALIIENNDSPYINCIAVRAGNEKSTKTIALNKAVLSLEVKDFIINNFKGVVLPSF